MSLFRRLWLTVAFTTLVAFAGSFVVSMLTARHYLEQQLYAHSTDTAAALALTMSQQAKDEATTELLVSALFDSGHFRKVSYRNVHGKVVVERVNELRIDNVPAFFAAVFPIEAREGEALVSDGWQQAGKVVILADVRFAYAALWSGALRLLLWIVAAGLLTGVLGSLILHTIRQPLDRVVEQAGAITERRFLQLDMPRIPELRAMVQALNSMVVRLKSMFDEEAARIRDLQRQVNGDALTGLANRNWFDSRLAAALADDDAAGDGCVLWLHLHELQGLNQSLGHERCDALLREVGELWGRLAEGQPDRVAARLVGGEFMLLAPRLLPAEAQALAQGMVDRLVALLDNSYDLRGNRVHLGIAVYHHGQSPALVREHAEQALTAAISDSDNAVALVDRRDPEKEAIPWQTLLARGLAERCFYLQSFPVVRSDGTPLHEEMALRLRHPDTGVPLSAAAFLTQATRLGLTPALDLEACRQGIALSRLEGRQLAINLSIESAQSADFLDALVLELASHSDIASRLWFEVSEHGLTGELRTLKQLTERLHPLGCRIGIDHFGRHFSSLPHLHALGLDYLKIDSSLISGLDTSAGNQALVRAIAGIAGNLGLLTIAERVQTPGERATLAALGVSGLTGPVLAAT